MGLRCPWCGGNHLANAESSHCAISLKSRLIKAERALKILERYNPLRNDLDAYLLDVIEFGRGKRDEPNPKHFGL